MVYPSKSLMDGADPESTHVTTKSVPPGTFPPGPGKVNFTSADARGHKAKRMSTMPLKDMVMKVVGGAAIIACWKGSKRPAI